MKIHIVIEDEESTEVMFKAESLTIDSAVQELYRFERIQELEQEKLQDSLHDKYE